MLAWLDMGWAWDVMEGRRAGGGGVRCDLNVGVESGPRL